MEVPWVRGEGRVAAVRRGINDRGEEGVFVGEGVRRFRAGGLWEVWAPGGGL